MSKLTRKQKAVIRLALQQANRAKEYIFNPAVAVARRSNFPSTTLHYSRADGCVLYEVTKEYGSELCGLVSCIRTLEHLLSEVKQ